MKIMIPLSLLSALTGALPIIANAAEIGSKPGLWQMTMDMKVGGAAAQVPQLTPEQLEKMKQLGIQLPGINGPASKPIVVKSCLTPEQAARNEPPNTQAADSGCETRNARHSGDTYTADMVCAGRLQGQGSVKVRTENPERYSGSWQFKGKANGSQREVDMTSEFTGQWLGSDCGSVKPGGGS